MNDQEMPVVETWIRSKLPKTTKTHGEGDAYRFSWLPLR
jgi:hypothetical protein